MITPPLAINARPLYWPEASPNSIPVTSISGDVKLPIVPELFMLIVPLAVAYAANILFWFPVVAPVSFNPNNFTLSVTFIVPLSAKSTTVFATFPVVVTFPTLAV